MYYSLIGGFPYLYKLLAEKQLLSNDADLDKIIKELYASSNQAWMGSVESYLEDEFGSTVACILEGIMNCPENSENSQVQFIRKHLSLPESEVFSLLEKMETRYGLVESEMQIFRSKAKSQPSRFIIKDPFLNYTLGISRTI